MKTNTEITGTDARDSTEASKTIEKNIIKLGDLNVTVQLPEGHGLNQQESTRNDYFATSLNGNYAVIANLDEKEDFDYTLEAYTKSTAEANKAEILDTTDAGHYYFTYKDADYHYYVSIRQAEEGFYRVTFYCFEKDWVAFEQLFSLWSGTITAG